MLVLLLAASTLAGIAYMLFATLLIGRWRAAPAPEPATFPSVTVLKPLHGAEPELAANLRSFLQQDYPAPVQVLCGASADSDSALPVARELGLQTIVDGTRHGSNGKVCTLANLAPHAHGELIVLSDSDMSVPRDYLRRICAALDQPGVGAVTCLYAGRGDAGGWSRLAAAGIGWQFLPGVLAGLALGLAKPCMGSTIALRRETLARIGGFDRFADLLADDHAIGAAVRALGLRVAVPPLLLTHGCAERSLRGLFAHELRWQRTVRLLDPWGYAGSVVTFPLPLALVTAALRPGLGFMLTGAALASRLLVAAAADRWAGRRSASLFLLPVRDLLGFAVYLSAFFVRRVRWREERLALGPDGRLARVEAA